MLAGVRIIVRCPTQKAAPALLPVVPKVFVLLSVSPHSVMVCTLVVLLSDGETQLNPSAVWLPMLRVVARMIAAVFPFVRDCDRKRSLLQNVTSPALSWLAFVAPPGSRR